MRRVLAVASAVAVAAAVTVVALSSEAEADKTVVLLSAPAEITFMGFAKHVQPDAGIAQEAEVCGRTRQSDGGQTGVTCHRIRLAPGNSINTSVQSLATGQALTFWRAEEGL